MALAKFLNYQNSRNYLKCGNVENYDVILLNNRLFLSLCEDAVSDYNTDGPHLVIPG